MKQEKTAVDTETSFPDVHNTRGYKGGGTSESSVVGYWRFEDTASDCSVFKNEGTIHGDASIGSVDAEECPIDQGDGLKVVNPGAFCCNAGGCFIIPIEMYGPLDIGICQEDFCRKCITIEFWMHVYQIKEEKPVLSRSCSHSSYTQDSSSINVRDIWSLSLKPVSGAKDLAIFFKGGGGQVIPAYNTFPMDGFFHHVALVIDSRGEDCNISIHVDGEKATRGSLPQNSFSSYGSSRNEKEQYQNYVVGAGGCNMRFTELRIRATARSVHELNDTKDTYLDLAEQRRKFMIVIGKGNDDSKEVPVPPSSIVDESTLGILRGPTSRRKKRSRRHPGLANK